MFKILLFVIPICVFVYAHDIEDKNESSENYVYTENYQASYEVVSKFKSDGDEQQGFIALAANDNVESEEATSSLSSSEVELEEANSTLPPPSLPNSEVELEKAKPSSCSPNLWNSAEIEEAKADIRAWAENLNCDNSTLGPVKCPMVKKLVQHFCENAKGIDLSKISKRIVDLTNKLKKSGAVIDPEMENLMKKYKKFLKYYSTEC